MNGVRIVLGKNKKRSGHSYRKNRSSKTRVLNLLFLICVLILAVSIYGVVALWEDKDLVILPFPFLILSVVMLLIEPICYVFSKKEISFIYFYGRRLIVSWQNVQAVERWYSYKLFSLDSVYRIHYGVVFRGRYVRQFASMLATPKLKGCFRKYYVGTISGEGERVARTKKGRKRRN